MVFSFILLMIYFDILLLNVVFKVNTKLGSFKTFKSRSERIFPVVHSLTEQSKIAFYTTAAHICNSARDLAGFSAFSTNECAS